MYIDAKHKIGSVVYLLTDDEQLKRVVTAIIVRSGGYVAYELSCGLDRSAHTEIEISKQKVYNL